MLNKKALAGTPSTPPVFVEDVFSTYLWDGNSTARSIVNNIDLATYGGMVWAKYRDASSNRLYDTNRGATKQIFSDLTLAERVAAQSLTSFNTNGFSLGTSQPNDTTATVVGWTFRKQAKFFDVVTYTGNGVTTGRTISHNLGSAPGMMILKVIDLAGDDWYVYHRSIPTSLLALNLTNGTGSPPTTPSTIFGNGTITVAPTSTQVTIGGTANSNGYSYVLYLFAHDAGGFGTAGTDNVITCGSFTTDGSGNATINLGYEPQYLMFKRSDSTGNWFVTDIMRGFSKTNNQLLQPNTSGAEFSANWGSPTATGFTFDQGNLSPSATYIYMAIRRPMKVPTDATTVFSPIASSAASETTLTTGFPIDFQIETYRDGGDNRYVADRLRGVNTTGVNGMSSPWLATNTTSSETASTNRGVSDSWNNTGFKMPGGFGSTNSVFYSFSRRPGFFDEVCYTGTGSATTFNHNLNVVPEMMIVKRRDGATNWAVYHSALGNTKWIQLNGNSAASTASTIWNNTTPTSSVFTVGSSATVNGSTATYVAYLFATCPGVSKVGSYTGTGATQTINCGFTGGARFVLIRRTDDWDGGNPSGDWYVWDTARGIIAGNDPYLLLNSTAAEVTSTDYIDPVSSGFEISSTAPAAINANGGSFIFMAIA